MQFYSVEFLSFFFKKHCSPTTQIDCYRLNKRHTLRLYYCSLLILLQYLFIMKVFLRYEDNTDESTHKTLKITLPKSWKSGPTSRLLEQFVESYNGGKEGELNTLEVSSLHLSVRRPKSGSSSTSDKDTELKDLPSDGIVLGTISDREDVYICHGPSRTLAEVNAEKQAQLDKIKAEKEAAKSLSK